MRIALVLVTYSMFPEKLFASIPTETHTPSWWVAHHGPDKALSDQIGAAVQKMGGTFLPYNNNRGLARSWNEGIKAGIDGGADMVMLLNDDLHFYNGGFDQFVEFSNTEFSKENVGMALVNGYESNGNWKGITQSQGYACCAISRNLIDRVGYFDENFWPAYYEDADYTQRIGMTGVNISVDPRCLVEHERSGTVRREPAIEARIQETAGACREYFVRKWGGDAGHATYQAPFNAFGPKIEFEERHAPYGAGRDRELAVEPPLQGGSTSLEL